MINEAFIVGSHGTKYVVLIMNSDYQSVGTFDGLMKLLIPRVQYFNLLRGSRPRLSFESVKWVPSQRKVLFALISPNFLFLPILYILQFADQDRRFDLCVRGNLDLTETFHSQEACRNPPCRITLPRMK